MKYDPVAWEIAFKKLDLYKQLANEYDIVYFNKQSLFRKLGFTPRQMYGDREKITYFSAIPFYYIEWLQEINPKKIYDLGCGWNIFKKYYPNIIGVGAEDPESPSFNADIHDVVDDDYILGHQEYFESVFSICALHFVPLSDIRKRVLDFASMIKPGGRGWLSMNAMRMLALDSNFKNINSAAKKSNPELYKPVNEDLLVIQDFCQNQLSDIPNLILLDIDLTVNDEAMDGNIQILFDKGQTK
jgi:hypothetical protein